MLERGNAERYFSVENMNRGSYTGGYGLGGMLPPAVKALLFANGIIFLMQELLGANRIFNLFGLTPGLFWSGYLWQPFTYMFLHGSFSHLLFNMLALWIFGSSLESLWGMRKFLRYYFLTGVGAALSNCLLTPYADVSIIGASGAIYGLLAAYGLLFPNSVIYISFLFPIRAKYLVLIFGFFEFVTSISMMQGANSPVAHIVHLGGMVIGVMYLKHRTLLRWGARKAKKVQRKKIIVKQRMIYQSEEKLRQEVDDLLDKINEVGIGNLTNWERKRLKQASEKLRQQEREGKQH